MYVPSKSQTRTHVTPTKRHTPSDVRYFGNNDVMKELRDRLTSVSCKDLRYFVRVLDMDIKNVSRVSKSDLVDVLVNHMKHSSTIVRQILDKRKEAYTWAKKHRFGMFNYKRFTAFDDTNMADNIINSLYYLVDIAKNTANQAYKQRDCKAPVEFHPQWGKRPNSDCGEGFALDPNGCCSRQSIHDNMLVWSEKQVKACPNCTTAKACAKHANIPQKQRVFVQKLQSEGVLEINSIQETQFRNAADAATTFWSCATFQKNLIEGLGEYFDTNMMDVLGMNENECDLTTDDAEEIQGVLGKAMKVGKAAFTGIYDIGVFLWKMLKWIVMAAKYLLVDLQFGKKFLWTMNTLKNIGLGGLGGLTSVVCTVTSQGQQMAYFIASNPASARQALAMAKLMKIGMCRFIGYSISTSDFIKVFEYNLRHHVMNSNNQQDIVKYKHTKRLEAKAKTDKIDKLTKLINEAREKSQDIPVEWKTELEHLIAKEKEQVDDEDDIFRMDESKPDGKITLKQYYELRCVFMLDQMQATFEKDSSMSFTEFCSKYELGLSALLQTYWTTDVKEQVALLKEPEEFQQVFLNSIGEQWNTLKDETKDAYNFAKDAGVVERGIEAVVKSDKVNKVVERMSLKVGKGVAALVGGVPFVGDFLKFVVEEINEVVVDVAMEAARKTAEAMLYRADVFASIRLLLEIFDVELCLSSMRHMRESCPAITYELILTKRIWAFWMKAQLSGLVSSYKESMKEDIVATFEEKIPNAAVTANSEKPDWVTKQMENNIDT